MNLCSKKPFLYSGEQSRHQNGTIMGKRDKRAGCGCCGGGIFGSIGAVLAALLSWSVNHSILWALVHAFLSWFYVIYHWLTFGKFLP